MSGNEEPSVESKPRRGGFLPQNVILFLKRESVLFAGLTGLSYHLAHKFYSAYLAYFGISSVFVELDISNIIVSATGVILLFVLIYQVTAIFPIEGLRRIAEAFFVYPHLGYPLLFLFFSFWKSGFSITLIVLFFYLIVFGGLAIFFLRRAFASGISWEDKLDSSIRSEREIRPLLLGSSIVDSKYGGVGFLFILVFFLSSIVATWAGHWHASREENFAVMEYDSGSLIVVGTFRENLIGAQFLRVEAEEGVILSGQSRLIPLGSVESSSAMLMNNLHFDSFSNPPESEVEWISFHEAWERLRNVFSSRD